MSRIAVISHPIGAAVRVRGYGAHTDGFVVAKSADVVTRVNRGNGPVHFFASHVEYRDGSRQWVSDADLVTDVYGAE